MDADIADAIKRLETFNEIATDLEQSKTYQRLLDGDAGINFVDPETGEPCSPKWYGPDKESRLIFTTLRYFTEDKDGFSLRKIAALYDKLPISPALQERLKEARAHINKTLSREIIEDGMTGRAWTFGDFITTYQYGEVLHRDEDKRALVKEWGKPRHVFVPYFMWQGFRSVVHAILFIRELNTQVIANLEAGGSDTEMEAALATGQASEVEARHATPSASYDG